MNYDEWTRLLEACRGLDSDRVALLTEMAGALEAIGPRARVALREQVRRLTRGATQYGEDFELRRNYPREALEEILDLSNYIQIALVDLMEKVPEAAE